MTEFAPDALKWLGSRVAPDLGGVLSGIVGDSAHKRGYHRGRNYVYSTDYSVQLTEDKKGDGEAACGIDMSFTEAKMRLYTGRLKAAADKNDPRLRYVREFYGTLNGTTVYGRTHKGSTDSTWESSTSDSSHLWHIHISILRQYANIRAVMQGILDVLMGKAIEENDMDATQDRLLRELHANLVAPFRWSETTKTTSQLIKDLAWGSEFGPDATGAWLPKAVAEIRTELVARDEADKVRDSANTAAVTALGNALNKVLTGGGSVDSAAIIAAVQTAATETQTKVAALQTALDARNAEIADLKARLGAAAQAEANALNN